MKIIIQPEDEEPFEPVEIPNVTDYFYAVRSKSDLGLPQPPVYGYFGEFAFLLGWLEYMKEIIKREIE